MSFCLRGRVSRLDRSQTLTDASKVNAAYVPLVGNFTESTSISQKEITTNQEYSSLTGYFTSNDLIQR